MQAFGASVAAPALTHASQYGLAPGACAAAAGSGQVDRPYPLQLGMHICPARPLIVTHCAPGTHWLLSVQRAYGPLGGCGLHWGQELSGEHAQLPPVPSQQAKPNCPHMAAHAALQLHGRPGRVPLVGGGSGCGAAELAFPADTSVAIMATPHCPVLFATLRARRM